MRSVAGSTDFEEIASAAVVRAIENDYAAVRICIKGQIGSGPRALPKDSVLGVGPGSSKAAGREGRGIRFDRACAAARSCPTTFQSEMIVFNVAVNGGSARRDHPR